MVNFELKTVALNMVEIPPMYSIWELTKQTGVPFGNALFQFYRTSDPTVFDKRETKKRLHDTSKWYYYRKLEKILQLSMIWHREQIWNGPVIIERSFTDARGKQTYVVHCGSDRFSVMRSYHVKDYKFLVINDRRSVIAADLDEIKKFYSDDLKSTVNITSNPHNNFPMIQSLSMWESSTDLSCPIIEQWVDSKLDFWQFVKS